MGVSAPAAQPLVRIGVYGGAFDPPHLAHSALAAAAVSQLELDTLLVVPTGQAWHKARQLTSAVDRLAMTRLAFAQVPRSVVDEREILRDGPTYTVDTLRELKQQYPASQLFLLMGSDQAEALHTWHEIKEITRLAIICVAERDAPTPHPTHGQDSQPAVLGIYRSIALPRMSHSATDIRSRVASGQNLNALVCEAVASYIQDNHLYPTAR
jgi:nicotinate-nucleotide adenylyltransferase